MVSAIPVKSLAQGAATAAAQIGFATLMLALSAPTAHGGIQAVSEQRVFSPLESSGFSAEIEYLFDTALNKTNARFKAPLAPKGFFSRLFSGSRDVHTLIVVYDFGGRAHVGLPETVRLSLLSDEYRREPAGERPWNAAAPILVVNFDDTIVRFPLGIAQRTEVWSEPEFANLVAHTPPNTVARVNIDARVSQVHIERTATASIPICDFMALVNGKDVHGTVAGLSFQLSEDVLAGLRQFASEMTPDAAARTSIMCGSR